MTITEKIYCKYCNEEICQINTNKSYNVVGIYKMRTFEGGIYVPNQKNIVYFHKDCWKDYAGNSVEDLAFLNS